MFGELVGELRDRLDALTGIEPEDCSDEALTDTVVALHEIVERARALEADIAHAWDNRRAWAADGAKSGAAWLAHTCAMSKPKAAGLLRAGRLLEYMPVARQAVHAGEITLDHVRVLGTVCHRRTFGLFRRDEKALVDAARTCTWPGFVRAVRYWELHADPDGTEAAAEARRARRHFRMGTTLDGDVMGDFHLDPIGGAILTTAIDRIERELFNADWADAQERLERTPTVDDLARTSTQRRADALVELARRAMVAPKEGQPPRPLFTVHVDYETFAGPLLELANRAVINPGALIPWLTEADIERAVFDGPSRIIDLGRRQRLFRGAARRAIEIRDRQCVDFACDVCAGGCDVDHVVPWEAGGSTDHDNGQLRCPFHNHQRQRRRPHPDTA
jgi:hypothetical protein